MYTPFRFRPPSCLNPAKLSYSLVMCVYGEPCRACPCLPVPPHSRFSSPFITRDLFSPQHKFHGLAFRLLSTPSLYVSKAGLRVVTTLSPFYHSFAKLHPLPSHHGRINTRSPSSRLLCARFPFVPPRTAVTYASSLHPPSCCVPPLPLPTSDLSRPACTA